MRDRLIQRFISHMNIPCLLYTSMPVLPGSQLDENLHKEGCCDHHDHFCNSAPETNWHSCVEHGEKIGLGTREYELITIR